LTSCDLSAGYYKFFPHYRRAWRDVAGVSPKLILVAEKIPSEFHQFADDVMLFPPIEDMHTAFQAQCIRLLSPATMPEENGPVLISDIDMIPLNSSYYTQTIATLRDDAFVVYRSDALPEYPQFAICYNAALPSTWSELFGGIRNDRDVRARLSQWWSRWYQYDGQPGGKGWDADQTILYEQATTWKKLGGHDRLVLLHDAQTGFNRLDRLLGETLLGRLTPQVRRDIRSGRYSDYHMLRPHVKYGQINEEILNLAISGQRFDRLIASALSPFRRARPF
jgi:hypothetical protein